MDKASQHTLMRTLTIACVFVIGTMALSGCREDEQARVLNYQPGVYKGKPDTDITSVARANARDRTYKQAGAAGMLSGGSAGPDRGDVRRPGQPSKLDLKALTLRARTQGG